MEDPKFKKEMDKAARPAAMGLTTFLILFQSITIACLILASGYFVLHDRPISPIFIVYSPQQVLTPEIKLGQSVKVHAIKCNLTQEDVAAGGITYWIRESPSYLRIESSRVELKNGEGVAFRPGCTERDFENKPPNGVIVGTWHLEGVNTVKTPYGLEQSAAWHTESFEVLP